MFLHMIFDHYLEPIEEAYPILVQQSRTSRVGKALQVVVDILRGQAFNGLVGNAFVLPGDRLCRECGLVHKASRRAARGTSGGRGSHRATLMAT